MADNKKIFMIGMIVCMVGILLSMVLPWFVYLDLYSFIPAAVAIRGWHSFYVLILGLVTIILAWVALRKDEPRKLLWITCISAILTFILSLLFWFVNSGDELVLDSAPRIGFWVILISTLGIVGFSLWSLFSQKSWLKELEQADQVLSSDEPENL